VEFQKRQVSPISSDYDFHSIPPPLFACLRDEGLTGNADDELSSCVFHNQGEFFLMKDVFDSFLAAAQKQKLVRETLTPRVQPFFPLFSSHTSTSTTTAAFATASFGLATGGQFLPVPPPLGPPRDHPHDDEAEFDSPLTEHISPLVAQAESPCVLTAYESVLSMAKLSASGKSQLSS